MQDFKTKFWFAEDCLNARNPMKKSFLNFVFWMTYEYLFFTYWILQVQELPSETERQGLRYGPVLRINCSQVVNFIKPVTIYLPVSLRGEPTGIPNTSLRVRVLFRNCDEDKEWTEITRDLRDPAQFDGKLVQFQVYHFSGYE